MDLKDLIDKYIQVELRNGKKYKGILTAVKDYEDGDYFYTALQIRIKEGWTAHRRGDGKGRHGRAEYHPLRRALRRHRPHPRKRALRGPGGAERLWLLRLRRGLPHPDPRRVRGRGLPVEGHPPAHHRLRRRRRGRFGRVPVREREEIKFLFLFGEEKKEPKKRSLRR